MPKEIARGVTGVDRQAGGAARAGTPLQGIAERRAHALTGCRRMDVEHVELLLALERGEADDRAVERGDQRELAGEPRGKFVLVIGGCGPGLLLRLGVVIRRQLFDAGAEDL